MAHFSGTLTFDNSSGSATRQFVYGVYIDEPLQMEVANGDHYFYQQNTLFSVHALTDENGDIVEAYEYDPYGRQTVITGPGADSTWFTSDDTRTVGGASQTGIDNPYMFTGRRFDPESGLMYYRTRYYDTERGRFIGRDSIGQLRGGMKMSIDRRGGEYHSHHTSADKCRTKNRSDYERDS